MIVINHKTELFRITSGDKTIHVEDLETLRGGAIIARSESGRVVAVLVPVYTVSHGWTRDAVVRRWGWC